MICVYKLVCCLFTAVLLCSYNDISTNALKWDGITPWYSDSTCNCNGFSTRCIFDEDLWEKTGHGGHCIDCAANRDGPNCERCRDNYYLSEDNECLPCYCNDIGSRSLQCSRGGKCDCKPGVTGEKCDVCASDYYDFGSSGCKECNCLMAGSWNNQPSCDQTLGKCECKDNVEGKECSSCKPGYFNLDEENKFGCTPCFCYGHATVCWSEPGYTKSLIESVFARNSEKWTAIERGQELDSKEVRYNGKAQDIGVVASGRDPVYFSAPDKFLGDQKASYNQELQFKLKVGNVTDIASHPHDIILEGNNLAVSQAIFGNGNSLPTTQDQVYKFTLHENPDFGWVPRLAAREFMSILSNLTAIKIRGTYSPRGTGFLDAVKLGTAIRGGTGKPANWIERCQCPEGYISQFCESCAPGYRHRPPWRTVPSLSAYRVIATITRIAAIQTQESVSVSTILEETTVRGALEGSTATLWQELRTTASLVPAPTRAPATSSRTQLLFVLNAPRDMPVRGVINAVTDISEQWTPVARGLVQHAIATVMWTSMLSITATEPPASVSNAFTTQLVFIVISVCQVTTEILWLWRRETASLVTATPEEQKEGRTVDHSSAIS
uniref:Laminin subunit gamma-1 n=1 Tax=Lygus hesperus TaxID=30085 RepID=A0A0K8T181_LYGHE